MTNSLEAERLTTSTDSMPDLARLRHMLARDPFATAYMLGDLDPIYAPFCAWWIASEGTGGQFGHDTPAADAPQGPKPTSKPTDVAVLQVYTGLSAPVVLTHGSAAGISAILATFIRDLPQRAHAHMPPEHLAVLDQYFTLDRMRPMVRMGLRASRLSVVADTRVLGYGAVERLSHRDTGDIIELSQHYPDSFFEPHQLSSGHYYGVRTDQGALIAVAGVHIVSRVDRLAAIGNIVTHPDHRGRGLSTRTTAHLCRELAAEGIELLALNVERRNTSAMRVYEKLGFVDHCTYVEAFLTRTLADQIEGSRPTSFDSEAQPLGGK